jgi:hypothetical protein
VTSTFGQGAFGVGNFATATPVNLATKGAEGGGGRSRWVLSPLFHPGRVAAAFSGRTRAIVVAWFVQAPPVARFAGRSSWRLFATYQGQPAPGVFSGQSWPVFAPRAFMSAPVTWRTGGRSLALLRFGGQFGPSPVQIGGRAGHLVVRPQWHRGRAGGFTAPIAHVRGAGSAFGLSRPRLLFTARFQAMPAAFSGHAVLSYSWSNTGAPGRTPNPDTWTTPGRKPAPAWGSAIPGASSDPWTVAAGASGHWSPVE